MRHHLVLRGQIVKTREFGGGPIPRRAPNGGAWLPEEVEGEAFDPATEVRAGPEIVIERERVRLVYTVRPKTVDEVAADRGRVLIGIKQEARRRILDRFPEWKQLNMTKRAVELADLRHDGELSAEEEAERQALKAAAAWVDAIRTRSDELEASVPHDAAGIAAFDVATGWDQ